MFKKSRQLLKIARGKTWRFFGGIEPPQMKYASEDPIEDLKIPSLITLPVDRHLGEGGTILVNAGDYVKRGQPLTVPGGKRLVPLHASTSGTVLSIAPQILPHPSGFQGKCITIKPDGLDAAVEPRALENWQSLDPQVILSHIRDMGIEGLGGALFQTASKLSSARDSYEKGCNIFIVNGCECEPGLSCDDRLMREQSDEIARGIEIIQKIISPKLTIVAIEDNKPEAAAAMKKTCEGIAQVRCIKARYPAGSARSLIKALTGIEIPYDAHTSECGIVVDNVGTVCSVKRAVVDGQPITTRIVTVLGSSMGRHGNARVRLGTSVRFILNAFKLNPEFHQRVIMGGPMMGFTLPSIDVPITKGTACIMAPGADELPPEEPSEPCIRCGRCARVCPSRLVPYQMYAYSRAGDHAHANKCGIADCVLCGCCSFACPSKINLTIQFRREQALQEIIAETERRNTRAREVAIEHEKREEERKKRLAEKKAAALKRIQENGKAKTASDTVGTSANADEDLKRRREAALKAARARALAKKAAAAPQMPAAAVETAAPAAPESIPEIKTADAPAQEAQVTDTTQTSAADGAAPVRSAERPLPYSLRKGGIRKRVQPIAAWDAPKDNAPELKLVGKEGDGSAPVTELAPLTHKLPFDPIHPETEPKPPVPENLRKLRRHH